MLRFWYLQSLSSYPLLMSCKRWNWQYPRNGRFNSLLGYLQHICRMSLEMLNSLGWFSSSSFSTTLSSSSSPLSLPSGSSSALTREGGFILGLNLLKSIKSVFKWNLLRIMNSVFKQIYERANECDWPVCDLSLLHQPGPGGTWRFWNHWKDWKNHSAGKHQSSLKALSLTTKVRSERCIKRWGWCGFFEFSS